jgi:hypothetical protein
MSLLVSRPWVLFGLGLLLGSPLCGQGPDTTIVQVGENGTITLPGQWSEVERWNWSGRSSVDLINGDSTELHIGIHRRSSYVLDTTTTPEQYVVEFYEMQEQSANGLGHWSCYAEMKMVEDRSEKRYVIWRITDKCGTGTIGLYGATESSIFDLSIRSSAQTEQEQIQFLVGLFKGNPRRP